MTTNPNPRTSRDAERIADLRALACQARRLIVQSVFQAQAGHLGGPLSAADILVALYFDILRVDPSRPDWPERDRFILSKGHSSIGLYSVLALRGFFPCEELATFDAINSRLQGHPDMRALPGLDMSTGSLGQGLSPGVGMALGARRRGMDARIYVMLGDGELQEGQVWEAAYIAARYGLDNLVAIVDHNGLPQYSWPNSGYGLRLLEGEIAARWEAFGWRVLEIDGHDMAALVELFHCLRQERDSRPAAVIARTVKGKGVSFMENQIAWHSRPMTVGERDAALAELKADR